MFPGIDYLASSTNMLFVVPNYRVAAHGFLALPSLARPPTNATTATSPSPAANWGVLDCVLALEWIQRHASSFGGDPSRVSVWGQSSGATLIYALLGSAVAMQSSNGAPLFHSAVALSGSPNITMGMVQVGRQNNDLLRSLPPSNAASRCALPVVATDDTQSVRRQHKQQRLCLLSLSANESTMIFPDAFNVGPLPPLDPMGQRYPGLLVKDGVVVQQSPAEAVAEGGMGVQVAVLVQNTQAEMDSFASNSSASIYRRRYDDWSVNGYGGLLRTVLEEQGWVNGSSERVMDLYRNISGGGGGGAIGHQQLVAGPAVELAWHSWMADYSMTCGNRAIALAAAGVEEARAGAVTAVDRGAAGMAGEGRGGRESRRKRGGAAAVRGALYLSLVAQAPSYPLYGLMGGPGVAPPARFAAHCWDYIVASRGWGLFHAWSAGSSPTYTPSELDLQLGDRMRAHWAELAHTGKIEALQLFATHGLTNVYQDDTVLPVGRFASLCTALSSAPLALGQGFWCVN
jgi:hypothetical protein